MLKKLLILSTVFMTVTSYSLAVSDITYYGLPNGQEKINSINFADVSDKGENYWAKPAIYQITSLGIMQGFSSDVFSPLTEITNEQAVATILNSMGKASEVEALNVINKTWSDKYIKYAMNNGLISGKIVLKMEDISGKIEAMKDKGVYIRDAAITREEIAKLLVTAFSIPTTSKDESKKPLDFMDAAQIDSEKKTYVDAVSMAGIMIGTDDGMFNPKSGLTRAEFAQILKNCEEYIVTNLGVTKHSGFVESAGTSNISIADSDGNNIQINVTGKNIPTVRNNQLGGISLLKSADEIDFFVDSSKAVKFIRVIDESIYGGTQAETESKSKQGIVTGNSPYFYEISIKDKNGNIEKYDYGRWTEIYKDGKETNAADILQGDTVYLEFDDVGDVTVIRAVTNSVISYGTVYKIDDEIVSIKFSDGTVKEYDVEEIPVYKNNEEVPVSKLYTGEYAKIYTSNSELIKLEIVEDERTAEGIYKGYISDINLIQDRIIIRNPEKFENGEWVSISSSFLTLPLDKGMNINYEGAKLEKSDLGEKHVGKYAYIATREDTQVLEKVKSISIGDDLREYTIIGKVSSYSSKGLLKVYDESMKPYIEESTIAVINNKIVDKPDFNKGDRIAITAVYEDDRYIAKVISSVDFDDDREVWAYFGEVTDVNKSEEVDIKATAKYEDDEWTAISKRTTSFTITSNTRIFDTTGPINIKEFDETYKGKGICIVAYGDEAVVISVVTLTDTPYIAIGSVKSVGTSDFVITDVESYDITNEEWLETGADETVTLDVSTAITKNGNYAKFADIVKNMEVIIIKPAATGAACTIILKD